MVDERILILGKHAVAACQIVAMKDAGDSKTSVWVVGQSAVDGSFLVDCAFEEAFKLWTGEEYGDEQMDTEGDREDEAQGDAG